MKNAASIAVFGLLLIILVNFYYVLVDFQTIHPVKHGGKIMGVMSFLGFLALLPFFLKFRNKRLFN